MPDLAPAALADAEVLDLSRRVVRLADPGSAFPTSFSGGAEVTLADGRKLFRHVRVNSGAGERAMDEAAVSEKFHASANLAFKRDKADRVRECVLALDTLSARELGMLLRG